MEAFKPISGFFEAIRNDGRISITHIGVYAALVQYWQEHDFINPMEAYSYEVMKLAKISASTTYHKCIRDLHAYGYVHYEPSFKRNRRSRIRLNF